jgi:hypothetical protein
MIRIRRDCRVKKGEHSASISAIHEGFIMSESTLESPSHTPSVLQRSVGVAVGVAMMFALYAAGSDMVRDGGAVPVGLVIGGGALLMVSARRNSPVLWNWFGRVMRSLLGEGPARAWFFLLGLVFSVTGVAALLG